MISYDVESQIGILISINNQHIIYGPFSNWWSKFMSDISEPVKTAHIGIRERALLMEDGWEL